jgi:tol-pal system protein YbgF
MHNMPSAKSFFAIIFVALLVVGGCVTEQDYYVLDERMSVLERNTADHGNQLRALTEQLERIESRLKMTDGGNAQSLRERLAESQVIVDQLRDEIRYLRGQIEETQYLIKQRQMVSGGSGAEPFTKLDEIEEMTRQTRNRVARIEQYLNLVEASKTPAEKSPPASVAVDREATSEADMYKAAMQAYGKDDYDTARRKFEAFLKKYPNSRNADNAQFWIGETYYREKWYEKAILEYQKVIDEYPKGNKVQASLLKQGLSFLNLGDKSNSRLILNELVSKYPQSNEASIAKEKLKEIK